MKSSCFVLFSSVVILAAVGCTNERKAGSAQVKVEIPALRSEMSMLSAPANAAAFTCVIMNVTGAGIEEHQGLGIVSSTVMASTGGTLKIQVPAGARRLFQVVGVLSANENCPSEISREALRSQTDYPALAELGREIADIAGDTTLRIKGLYDASSAVDLRTKQPLSGGGVNPTPTPGPNPTPTPMPGPSPVPTPTPPPSPTPTPNPTPTPSPTPIVVTNCSDAASLFSGGNGTSGTPYQVSSVEQWNVIGTYVNLSPCHFVLTQNLDFEGATPKQIDYLTGGLDGANFKISNGVIPRSNSIEMGVGLIRSLHQQGVIRNLTVENFSYSGTVISSEKVGVLVAVSRSGGAVSDAILNVTIKDSSITVTNSMFSYVGVMVGELDRHNIRDSTIQNVDVNLASGSNFGGFTPFIQNAEISGCMVDDLQYTGTTTDSTSFAIGGIVGRQQQTGAVRNCLVKNSTLSDPDTLAANADEGLGGAIGHARGVIEKVGVLNVNLSGGSKMGGLVGTLRGSATLTDSFAEGVLTIHANGAAIGGAVGFLHAPSAGTRILRVHSNVSLTSDPVEAINGFVGQGSGDGDRIVDSYWNTIRAGAAGGEPSAAGLAGLTTVQMGDSSNFTDWDFTPVTGVWEIPMGYDHPVLQILGPW